MIPRDLLLRHPRRCGRALLLCYQKSKPSDFSYLDLNRPGLIVATSDLFDSGDMHHHIPYSSMTGSEISIWLKVRHWNASRSELEGDLES
ncbi:hypothetical protein AAC387_Pa06g3089 [Persea americana]